MAVSTFSNLILCLRLALDCCIECFDAASSLSSLDFSVSFYYHNLLIDKAPCTSDLIMSVTVFDDKSSMLPPPLPSPRISTSDGRTLRSLKRLSLKPVPKLDHDASTIHCSLSAYPSDSSSDVFMDPTGPPSRRSSTSMESNSFLTALAAQERKVLELKEELHKAEFDLEQLKKQWAIHEASKKREEMRHVEKLRPIVSPIRPLISENEKNSCSSLDQSRVRTGYSKAKQPHGKVFSGSRHIRTLSLLSPGPQEAREADLSRGDHHSRDSLNQSIRTPTRSATVSDKMSSTSVSNQGLTTIPAQHNKGFPKEDLVNTGKQLFGDVREGLWTFIEDLRQATVGEEAVSNARSKQIRGEPARSLVVKKANGAKSQVPSRIFSVPMMDKTIGAQTARHQSSKPNEAAVSTVNTTSDDAMADDDGWGNWESPSTKTSSPDWSTSARSGTPSSPALTSHSRRTSLR